MFVAAPLLVAVVAAWHDDDGKVDVVVVAVDGRPVSVLAVMPLR